MPELWQPIEGFEKFYEVSTLGKVRRIDSGRVLKPSLHRYAVVALQANGVRTDISVHRLVGIAFVTGDKSLTINHRDGNKLNNRADNLEWATSSEQALHAIALGLRPKGGNRSKLSPEQCTEVADRLHAGETQVSIAKHFGVSKSCIWRIAKLLPKA